MALDETVRDTKVERRYYPVEAVLATASEPTWEKRLQALGWAGLDAVLEVHVSTETDEVIVLGVTEEPLDAAS